MGESSTFFGKPVDYWLALERECESLRRVAQAARVNIRGFENVVHPRPELAVLVEEVERHDAAYETRWLVRVEREGSGWTARADEMVGHVRSEPRTIDEMETSTLSARAPTIPRARRKFVATGPTSHGALRRLSAEIEASGA